MTIMTRRQSYILIYARGVTKHLKSIDAKYDSLGCVGGIAVPGEVDRVGQDPPHPPLC
jgi:hypothetical protein